MKKMKKITPICVFQCYGKCKKMIAAIISDIKAEATKQKIEMTIFRLWNASTANN